MNVTLFLLPVLVALAGCEVSGEPSDTSTTPVAASEDAAMPDSKSDEAAQAKDETAKQEIPTVEKSEAEWRKELTREEYRILREKGTERAFSGQYDHTFKPGAYACAGCGMLLFESDTKFNSGCGWPAFYAAKAGNRVVQTPDYTLGMVRVEVTCARCGGHLGHVFDDAPGTPTGQRYCINSVSLKFIPEAKLPDEEKLDAKRVAGEPESEPAEAAETEAKPAPKTEPRAEK
jgi:peptide-methionine (R)-S-oxide reductase